MIVDPTKSVTALLILPLPCANFPKSLSSAGTLVVPDFSQVSQDVQASALKSKCDEAKALGLARVDVDRNMVVYEGLFFDPYISNNYPSY